VTFNLFDEISFLGPEVCAYDRAAMLHGDAATQHCYILDYYLGGLLPTDLDSPILPPAGAPNYVLGIDDADQMSLWKFHVDWSCSADGVVDCGELSDPSSVATDPFTPACGGGECIPQKGQSQQLDSLADRLMYRLAYRNFGGHESLVVNHTVTAGSAAGVRWYELRNTPSSAAGTPAVYQQGTYAPADGKSRWMGSVAMDGAGNIALGYSISSASMFPSLAYSGRLQGDLPGTMTQGETVFKTGAGSQQIYGRWGDCSGMSIDPADDCTFWYTGEYLPNTGAFNWRTQVVSFKLPGCVAATVDQFSLNALPATVTIVQGASDTSSIATATTNGSAQNVALTATGAPFDTTVSFTPPSVSSGDSATMTVDVGEDTPPGTYTLKVRGTGSADIRTTNVTLVVKQFNAVVNGDFENGFTGWTQLGAPAPLVVVPPPLKKKTVGPSTLAHSAQLGAKTGAGDSELSQVVYVPSGDTALTFWYLPTCKTTGDQIRAQIRDAAGTTTLQTLVAACTRSKTWVKAAFNTSTYAGQTVTIWFSSHAISAKKSATFLVDDVMLGRQPPQIANPGFETDLSGWQATGTGIYAPTPVTSPLPHGGTRSVRLGTVVDPFAGGDPPGDSAVSQAVVVPGVNPMLTLWYQPHCTDGIQFDQIQVKVKSPGGQALGTLLNSCTNSTKWTKLTFSMSAWAGQSVTLWLNVHNDSSNDTDALFDDVSLTGG
jgi:hypothetical protein